MSREFCIIERGRPSDAPLHDPILANPAADEVISRQAVEGAMRRGLTREQAERLYGISTKADAHCYSSERGLR
jgi:hypothetical protein